MAAVAPFRSAMSAPRFFSSPASSVLTSVSASITSTFTSSALISSRTMRIASLFAHRLAAATPALPALPLSLPSLPSLPSLLGDIWESILRAVPKKKTSHSKKRHRQMAGKALKDVNSLCKCPACGRTKRMHHMCPHSIREMLKKN
ncbi:MAG: Ski complex subunit Rec14 [Sporothrix thermara]